MVPQDGRNLSASGPTGERSHTGIGSMTDKRPGRREERLRLPGVATIGGRCIRAQQRQLGEEGPGVDVGGRLRQLEAYASRVAVPGRQRRGWCIARPGASWHLSDRGCQQNRRDAPTRDDGGPASCPNGRSTRLAQAKVQRIRQLRVGEDCEINGRVD
eukprot:scaffold14198_cov124-Isochrysis_galbana.AAC.3